MLLMILGQRQLCWNNLKLDDAVKFFDLLPKCNLLADSILHIIVRQFVIFCLEVMQMRHNDAVEYGDRGRGRGVDFSVGD